MVLCYIHETIQSYILGLDMIICYRCETIHSYILGARTWSYATDMKQYMLGHGPLLQT